MWPFVKYFHVMDFIGDGTIRYVDSSINYEDVCKYNFIVKLYESADGKRKLKIKGSLKDKNHPAYVKAKVWKDSCATTKAVLYNAMKDPSIGVAVNGKNCPELKKAFFRFIDNLKNEPLAD